MFSRTLALVALLSINAQAQSVLDRAYNALRAKEYDQAIRLFQQGLAVDPANIPARKDLAYTLLKTGDSEAARWHLRDALTFDPNLPAAQQLLARLGGR